MGQVIQLVVNKLIQDNSDQNALAVLQKIPEGDRAIALLALKMYFQSAMNGGGGAQSQSVMVSGGGGGGGAAASSASSSSGDGSSSQFSSTVMYSDGASNTTNSENVGMFIVDRNSQSNFLKAWLSRKLRLLRTLPHEKSIQGMRNLETARQNRVSPSVVRPSADTRRLGVATAPEQPKWRSLQNAGDSVWSAGSPEKERGCCVGP